LTCCWFCLQPLTQAEPCDRHHKLPRRYLKKEEKKDKTNVVISHCLCHQTWHRRHDPVKLRRAAYIKVVSAQDWGHGIFAQPDALAAD
jgi:hypothetical protein